MKIHHSPEFSRTSQISQKKESPFKKIGQELESQFVEYLLKEMEKTADNSDEQESPEKSYYQSLLRSQRAQLLSEHQGGLGLGDLIAEQLEQTYKGKGQ